MLIKQVPHIDPPEAQGSGINQSSRNRVRTLSGKEIELDIESDYKACPVAATSHPS